ncbi:Bacterial membrane flanked domain protein [Actinomadura rubteroloni]|uniref:Bacterial membrane flanked domain protein n=1 Tax=Actinomadura rubteroloni TaxID=1926885 RepID=A0A2P4UL45_9ACTN|nr:PH domain-containing protein [Actinomadura rubteroloni]POM25776.1 Bacterial membrane flanked domain protein [Actinomadura rubteroloni]
MNATHGEPPQVPATAAQGTVPHAPPPSAADSAFAPGDGRTWARVSRRHTLARGLAATLWALPCALGGGLVGWRNGGVPGAVVVVSLVVVALAVTWIVAELTSRSYGYAERDDDLILTSGVFVRRLVVVPYARMEFVDVTSGLVDRWLGLATVRLHTAAAATDARIPSLPVREAGELRDRLAHRGEQRSTP